MGIRQPDGDWMKLVYKVERKFRNFPVEKSQQPVLLDDHHEREAAQLFLVGRDHVDPSLGRKRKETNIYTVYKYIIWDKKSKTRLHLYVQSYLC